MLNRVTGRQFSCSLLLICSILLLLAACGGSSSGAAQSSGGPVNITIDHSSYIASDAINVTITNTLQTPIYAFDIKASCSILDLEIQTNNTWQASQAAPCALQRRNALVRIDAGKTYSTKIYAGTTSGQGSFPSSTYRLALNYWTTAPTNESTPGAVSVYSATFTAG